MKSLTDREREIILTLAEGGLSNRDVARQLTLSEGTVKAHLHNIYKKLGVNKRTALVAMAHTRRELRRR
jgi:two-component system nitrate/nitrite response regulator NarL